jgi:hypothetical protein
MTLLTASRQTKSTLGTASPSLARRKRHQSDACDAIQTTQLNMLGVIVMNVTPPLKRRHDTEQIII